MQSAEQPLRGAARVVRPDRLSKLMWLVAAVMAVAGLPGCCGAVAPSPSGDGGRQSVGNGQFGFRWTAGGKQIPRRQRPRDRAECYGCDSVRDATPPATTADNSTPRRRPRNRSRMQRMRQRRGCNTARYDSGQFNTSGGALDTGRPNRRRRPNQRRRRRQPRRRGLRQLLSRHRRENRRRRGPTFIRPVPAWRPAGPMWCIRFTESSIDYEKTLAEAVKRAVARKPNLAFDLVAVTPQAGTADELAELTNQAHAEAAGRDEVAVRLGDRAGAC